MMSRRRGGGGGGGGGVCKFVTVCDEGGEGAMKGDITYLNINPLYSLA